MKLHITKFAHNEVAYNEVCTAYNGELTAYNEVCTAYINEWSPCNKRSQLKTATAFHTEDNDDICTDSSLLDVYANCGQYINSSDVISMNFV